MANHADSTRVADGARALRDFFFASRDAEADLKSRHGHQRFRPTFGLTLTDGSPTGPSVGVRLQPALFVGPMPPFRPRPYASAYQDRTRRSWAEPTLAVRERLPRAWG